MNSSDKKDFSAVAAQEWRAIIEPLLPLGESLVHELHDPGDPLLRQELYRLLCTQIANAFLGLVQPTQEHPDLWPSYTHANSSMGTNPDFGYHLTPLGGGGVYRLSGYRGTVRIVNITIGDRQLYVDGSGPVGAPLFDYDLDSLRIGDDGHFEVLLSETRPDGYAGDWWYLTPEATYLYVRQISYDWLHEEDARISIVRLDRPAAKPRQNAEQLARTLRQIPVFAENWSRISIMLSKQISEPGYVNTFGVFTHADQGGVKEGGKSQRYLEGIFELEEGEAWVYEVEMPKKNRYWGFQLCDELYVSPGYLDHQTSLNAGTVRLDGDGKLRIVMSASDPGVPNWIDTMGLKRFIIVNRWLGCDIEPLPTLQRVKVSQVRDLLPADTPRVSHDEREEQLRLRKKAVQLRRRW